MEVIIYSKNNCVFCEKAKIRLQMYNPKIKMLNEDYTREEFFKKFPNAKTFPQIIINNQNIGGYHELQKWFDAYSSDEDF